MKAMEKKKNKKNYVVVSKEELNKVDKYLYPTLLIFSSSTQRRNGKECVKIDTKDITDVINKIPEINTELDSMMRLLNSLNTTIFIEIN